MSIERADVVSQIDKLPAFNATVAKVIQLSNDPKSQPKDLVHAISIDPILTAEILKLINSAYFGVATQVVSLQRAVVMLGLNTVKNLALSSSLISNIKMRNNFQWFTSDEFWEHSLGTAVGAKLVAASRSVPIAEREEYFIAGLLHDMGKIVFVQYHHEEYARIMDPDFRPGERKSNLEVESFGVNHAELGGLMTESWKLPQSLCDSIKEHHRPSFNGDSSDIVKAAVSLSDFVCNKRQLGIKSYVGMEEPDPMVWEVLSLDEGDVDGLFANLDKEVEKAKVFLRQ